MSPVFIGMGSNIDPVSNIRGGIDAIKQQFGKAAFSSIYESRAFGFEGDNFYNLVAGFETAMTLTEITEILRRIEYTFGRKRQEERFMSRTLDIDLLLYGDLVRHDDEYDLPREDIVRYPFVLCPLAEIAGNEKHPELGETYNALWAKFDKSKHELWKVNFPAIGE